MAKAKSKAPEPIVETSDDLVAPLTSEVEPPVTDAVEITDDTLLEVWDRRFVNPGMRSATPVQLRLKGMVVRWINTAVEGRYHRAVYDQGWKPVPLSALKDPASIPDLFKHPHNIVARGERGKEVLMMMPEKVYKRITRRKAELNIESLKKIRSEMAEAAGSKFGPEAGDFIHSGRSADGNIKTVGSVQFGTERVALGDEG